MIRKEKDYFILDTDHTTYCFRVLPTGQLEHLYYGRKLHIEDEADMQPLLKKAMFLQLSFTPKKAAKRDLKFSEISLTL